MKIAVTDDRFSSYVEEEEILSDYTDQLLVCPPCEGEEILEYIADADALLVNQYKMTASIIRQLEKCRILSRYGIGYDNVDIDAATGRNIWVARVPDYCFDEVGEHALAMLLALARQLPLIDAGVRRGEWNIHVKLDIPRVAGSTLGILGFGGTGRAFARKCSGIGFGRVLVCDPFIADDSVFPGERVSFEELLEESDYLSLHIPYNSSTRHIINRSALARMKKSAVLINTSRGAVVDTNALYQALAERSVAAAGLDVFEDEPPVLTEKIRSIPGLLVSDHSAYYSSSSIAELKKKAALNIVDVFEDKAPGYPVNILEAVTRK
ncbi:MAG: C-terminal binding protein [Spirochaetales bacterium]|nr:C-terminal binding protein [Spirochaetales bacterium]